MCASRARATLTKFIVKGSISTQAFRDRPSGLKGLLILLVAVCALAIFVAWSEKRQVEAEREAVRFALARADFLQSMSLAGQGNKAQALMFLARSLRRQPHHNPAAGVAFELLLGMEKRTGDCFAFIGHTDGILFATFSPDGSLVATASKDHTAQIWDAQTGVPVGPPLQHADEVNTVDFSPDGTQVVTASADHTARVWNARTGQPVSPPLQHDDNVWSAFFSPDGSRVATGSDDSTARIWDAGTGASLISPLKFHDAVYSTRFSPDGKWVVTASTDLRADIWDAGSGKHLAGPLHHGNGVFSAVFSPDGRRVLTASVDFTAQVWDSQTGQALMAPLRHDNWVNSALYSPDGRRIVTASLDHSARVWDAQTGQPLTLPLMHQDNVFSAAFNPASNRVVTASADHTARVWDAQTGDPITPSLQQADEVRAAVFSPNGREVLTASLDHTARLWDMPPDTDAPGWLADLAESVAEKRIDERDHIESVPGDEIVQLGKERLASTSADRWEQFGRWFFSDAATRTVSPWSTCSLHDYVRGLITRDTPDSLNYAEKISWDHPAWVIEAEAAKKNPQRGHPARN